jgi:hypothetical protein
MSEQAPDLSGFKRSQCDLFANEPARNNGVGSPTPTISARASTKCSRRPGRPSPPRHGMSGRRATIKSFFRKWRTGCQMPRPNSCVQNSGPNWTRRGPPGSSPSHGRSRTVQNCRTVGGLLRSFFNRNWLRCPDGIGHVRAPASLHGGRESTALQYSIVFGC